jgi:predicted negative regulator of RcsB-dependent stress response
LEKFIEKLKTTKTQKNIFLEGIEGFKKLGDKEWEVNGCKYLGDLYMDKGDKQKAKEYYKRAYYIIKTSFGKTRAEVFLLNIKGIDIKELDKSN